MVHPHVTLLTRAAMMRPRRLWLLARAAVPVRHQIFEVVEVSEMAEVLTKRIFNEALSLDDDRILLAQE